MQAIDTNEVVWRALYRVAGSSEISQQVFSNFGPQLPLVSSGNINGDGAVDFTDLALLASQWLGPPGTPSADIAPTPDGVGIVDFLDFAVLAENWLKGI
jgi:hypothetical protein